MAPGNFDLVLVNDDVEEAYTKLQKFLYPDISEVLDYMKKRKEGAGDA